MTIETPNLRLRHLCLEDAAALLPLSQEAGMRRWIPDQVYADLDHAQRVVRYLVAQYAGAPRPALRPFVLGVVLRATGELIGHVGLSPLGEQVEIGYAVGEAHQGRQLATEAVAGVTRFALAALALPNLLGVADVENRASCRILEKCGFALLREERRQSFGQDRRCRIYEARAVR